MAAHGKQSEKCRREATWLDGKPYLQSYPMVSTPEFDPDSGQTKMGQIWVNSQKKAKTTPEPQGARVVFCCRFLRKTVLSIQQILLNKGSAMGASHKKARENPRYETWGFCHS